MLRAALVLALGFAAVTLAGSNYTARAEDKKEDKAKKLEGKLVCTKCELSETDKCANALQVKKDDKTVTYYLVDKGNKEKYHPCSKPVDAVVTGKVVKKEEKLTIENAKVEVKK